MALKGADTLIADASLPNIAERLPVWHRQHLRAGSFLLLPMALKGAPFALIYADKPEPGSIDLGEKELVAPSHAAQSGGHGFPSGQLNSGQRRSGGLATVAVAMRVVAAAVIAVAAMTMMPAGQDDAAAQQRGEQDRGDGKHQVRRDFI